MSRIATAAHVSKTTLYARFTSKEQMFRAITRRQIDSFSVESTLRSGVGLEQGLKAYALRTLEIGLRSEIVEVNRLIFSEAGRFPELAAAAAERTRIGVEQIASFIRECAAADGMACRDAEGVAEVFILMLRGWYLNAMLTREAAPRATRERWVERAVHALVASRAEW
jgi:AcrR family transcriptional regulator